VTFASTSVARKAGENRRGVVFIAEIVAETAWRRPLASCNGENYICLPMKHAVSIDGPKRTVKYQWQVNNQWSQLTADAIGPPQLPRNESLEQFITEHYWVIRDSETETPWNIRWLMCRGECG